MNLEVQKKNNKDLKRPYRALVLFRFKQICSYYSKSPHGSNAGRVQSSCLVLILLDGAGLVLDR